MSVPSFVVLKRGAEARSADLNETKVQSNSTDSKTRFLCTMVRENIFFAPQLIKVSLKFVTKLCCVFLLCCWGWLILDHWPSRVLGKSAVDPCDLCLLSCCDDNYVL